MQDKAIGQGQLPTESTVNVPPTSANRATTQSPVTDFHSPQAWVEPASPAPSLFHLAIESLVLRDVVIDDRIVFGQVVEQELARLVAQYGWPQYWQAGGVWPRLDGGEFRMRSGASAAEIGRQVAAAIYRSLGGSGEETELWKK